jgi:DNA polymerase III sliding clamp (beta) subunit (PCNA family)
MLKELKFVQGAVAKKDFIPAITHFAIENGTVRAFNGTIALCSPLKCDLNCKPKAIPMVQAIARCNDTISLSMTPAGRLSIKSGNFKAYIECVEETAAHVEPEGDRFELDAVSGKLMLEGLKMVLPFVGNDASRQWTNGILLKDKSAFATNNVSLIQYFIGVDFPHVVNIPKAAIVEMLRVNEPPTHGQINANSITFHYGDGRWIRSQLYETTWPDMARILEVKCNPEPVPEKLFEGLEVLKPFVNKLGQVFITEQGLRTHESHDEGASFDLNWAHCDSLFNIEMLALLEGVAASADFNLAPDPCMFYGERWRGALIGMRMPGKPE